MISYLIADQIKQIDYIDQTCLYSNTISQDDWARYMDGNYTIFEQQRAIASQIGMQDGEKSSKKFD